MDEKPKLRLLYGGRAKHVSINGVKVSAVPASLHPLPVDVKVFEEDTHLILTVDPVMRFSEEHPIRLMTDILDAQEKKPGQVVINNNSWYAIVHDLDAEETCRPQWVGEAYHELFRLAGERQVERLGTPLLGSVHGNMKPARSLEMMLDALRSGRKTYPEYLLLLLPPGQVQFIKAALIRAAEGEKRGP